MLFSPLDQQVNFCSFHFAVHKLLVYSVQHKHIWQQGKNWKKITMIPSVWVIIRHRWNSNAEEEEVLHSAFRKHKTLKNKLRLLTSEARRDMRLGGLHSGEFSLSCCSFLRNSGGRRMSMGRDICLLTSWKKSADNIRRLLFFFYRLCNWSSGLYLKVVQNCLNGNYLCEKFLLFSFAHWKPQSSTTVHVGQIKPLSLSTFIQKC